MKKTAERTITVSSVLLALTLGTLGFSVLISTGYNFTLLFLAVYILFYLILKQRGTCVEIPPLFGYNKIDKLCKGQNER